MAYRRVLLKISGEALAGENAKDASMGIGQYMLTKLAKDIGKVVAQGVQVCLVVGSGNIWRGVTGSDKLGIDRSTSDHMGMLATVINALALQNTMELSGLSCRMMTAIPMAAIGEPYIRRRAITHMTKGRVVIFAAGTGNPFFTTDTAAALRALEMDCDLVLKATKVDGVYDMDPQKFTNAVHYPELTYTQVLTRNLGIMDATAIALMRENALPLAVFNIFENDGFSNVIEGKGKYTIVSDKTSPSEKLINIKDMEIK